MTRVVIIGGSGHVGTYLVPRLVESGFEVVNVSRGSQQPYLPHAAWEEVEAVVMDRETAEAAGSFGQAIADLEPDIVIDMICFTLGSAQQLVEALRGKVQHFLHCGTIWIYGHSVEVPASEMQPRRPFGEYGMQKAAIEAYLLDEARRNGFPAMILHPGHIVGPGHIPLNPAGNRNLIAFQRLARGELLTLPNIGMETLHHVHADDIAQLFMLAIGNWSQSVGESFHAVAETAVTVRGYAEAAASWFGQEANLAFLPYDEWKKDWSEADAQDTWEHISRSPNASIAKARRLLNYQPRYTTFTAVYESLMWLIEQGELEI